MKNLVVIIISLLVIGCKEEPTYENINFDLGYDTVTVKRDTVVKSDTIIKTVYVDTTKKASPDIKDTINVESKEMGILELGEETKSMIMSYDSLLCDVICTFPLGSPESSIISSDYGYRKRSGTGKREFHHGIDIVSEDSIVYSVGNGIVEKVGYSELGGLYVVIQHELLSSFYAHLDTVMVYPNDTVDVYDEIGIIGETGNATGKHLHYEIRKDGSSLNVFDYYKNILNK